LSKGKSKRSRREISTGGGVETVLQVKRGYTSIGFIIGVFHGEVLGQNKSSTGENKKWKANVLTKVLRMNSPESVCTHSV